MEYASQSLKSHFTIRYIIGLLLIAVVMVSAFTVLMGQLKTNEQYSYIINISGMQRMLSQRIGLMAHEIHITSDQTQAEVFATKMRGAVDKMQSNHKELTSGQFSNGAQSELSTEMRETYYGEMNLDQKVRIFTRNAQDFLNQYYNGGIDAVQKRKLAYSITEIANNGLLSDLNSAVYQYQYEAEDNIENFRRLEILFFATGLLVLLFEALFIFRPMTKIIDKSVRKIEENNQELVEFSYRISHDLRAPIVSSSGLSGLAVEALKDGDIDSVKQSAGFIHEQMERLGTLIDDILELTELKLTNNELENEPVVLPDLVDDILQKLNNLPRFEEIEVRQSITVDHPIQTKRTLLDQIVSNLISNAVKYSDFDKDQPQIDIRAEEKNGRYVISISDNGIGIPEKHQEKIFGMFQRFHPKTAFGSGLGLYIVRQQAEALNGSIDYVSLPNGSKFELSLKTQKIRGKTKP